MTITALKRFWSSLWGDAWVSSHSRDEAIHWVLQQPGRFAILPQIHDCECCQRYERYREGKEHQKPACARRQAWVAFYG